MPNEGQWLWLAVQVAVAVTFSFGDYQVHISTGLAAILTESFLDLMMMMDY
jgi:hypothetical protein